MKSFLKNTLVYLLVVCLVVAAVDLLYLKRINDQDTGTVGTARNDSATIKNVPDQIDICNFGNSHSFYALNYEDVQDHACFSFALPDQSLRDDLQIFKSFKDHITSGAIIFISISYTSLMGPAENDFSPMYKRYYRFLPKENIIGYSFTTDLYTRFLPALAADDMIALFEMLFNTNNHADIWALTTNPEAASDHGYRRYLSHVAPSRDSSGNRRFRINERGHLLEMIDLCRDIGAIPVLLTVPFLREYTDPILEEDPSFYDDFFAMMNEICEEKDVTYLDYSRDKRFSDRYDLFINTDHLNRNGAAEFTRILITEGISDRDA